MLDQGDRNIDRLLAQGRLAGPEKERLLQNALSLNARDSAETSPQRRWHRLGFGLGAAAVVAAAVLLIPTLRGDDVLPAGQAIRHKGQAPSGTYVEVGCATACRAGETLFFRIQGYAQPVFVTAYAVRERDGTRIWYFPGPGRDSPRVASVDHGSGILRSGVRLGPEHPPGSYQVHIILTSEPIRRDNLDSAHILARETRNIQVVP